MRRGPIVQATCGLVWLLVVSAGLAILWDYATSAGIAATPPTHWPTASRIEVSPEQPTLVMLLHPHCPCSHATIEELDRLMARARGLTAAHVLFLAPSDQPDDWAKTDLWRRAARIPGVMVMADPDGTEAARFHAATSGQTLLYDARGTLVFSGGITSARGHAGDNAGRDAIVGLLTEGRAKASGTPVFGCSLLDPRPAADEDG